MGRLANEVLEWGTGAGWRAGASATIARAGEPSNRRAHGNVGTARLGRAFVRERRRARSKCDIKDVFWDFNISWGALLLVSEEGCGRKHRGKQEQTKALDDGELDCHTHHLSQMAT